MPGAGFTAVTRVSTGRGQAEPAPAASCLVVVAGPDIGKHHLLDRPEHVLGRSGSADIQVEEESASRQHAKLVTRDGRTYVYDLGSTNGTFVNDVRCSEAELRDGDLVRIGRTVLKYLSSTSLESKYYEETYRLISLDALTGVYNKRCLLEALTRELNRAVRYGRALSVAMLDVDHFKRVNDELGHLAGDGVLRELAAVVSENVRRGDVFARYGGEEFALVLPETDGQAAVQVCEKIRARVEEHVFEHEGRRLPVSVSLGVRTLQSGEQETDPARFIAGADARLYEAKAGGRNRVCA